MCLIIENATRSQKMIVSFASVARIDHPQTMSLRYLASLLMGLGIVGMTVAVVWWYDYSLELREFFEGKAPPPFGCLYKVLETCRSSDAAAIDGGVRPYRPELLWIGAASFVIGSAIEFVQVIRREIAGAV